MRLPFQKIERYLEFSSCRQVLSEILSDNILVQHCTQQKDYYLDIVNSNSEISATELVVAINDLGIMLLENKQISTMYDQFSTFSRIARLILLKIKLYMPPGMKQAPHSDAINNQNGRSYSQNVKAPPCQNF